MNREPNTLIRADGLVETVAVQPGLYSVGIVEQDTRMLEVKFQRGPIGESGINGVQVEQLLAICLDRLQSFGNSRDRDTNIALTHIEDALLRLDHRTMKREARGVEGTRS